MLSATFVGVWETSTQSTACSGLASGYTPPAQLTPSNPVLLPRCVHYSVSYGRIVFTVDNSVDLRGGWVANGELGVYVANSSQPVGAPECPSGACTGDSGTLNYTLLPGTYVMGFWVFGNASPNRIVTVTQTIQAIFDRGLDVLQPVSDNISVPANGYDAWPVSTPAGASGFIVGGSMSIWGCSFSIAILSPVLFQAFQNDRNAIYSSDAVSIYSSAPPWCVGPPSSFSFTGGFPVPNLASGETLVFWNSSGSAVCPLAVWAPIEVSYLLPD